MGNPLISVIIPVYNVEKYLCRCIDSVIAQTYKNLEIILVDDGSTDNCGKICDEYAEKDKRFVVIHGQNAGVSAARNCGLDSMNGDYVMFVDADDWVHPQIVELLYNDLINHNADYSCCDYTAIYEQKNDYSYLNTDNGRLLNRIEALSKLNASENGINNAVWGKLFTANQFKQIRFPVGRKIAEDMVVSVKVLLSSSKIFLSKNTMYYYYQRNNSAIHIHGFSLNEISDSTTEIIDFCKTLNIEEKTKCDYVRILLNNFIDSLLEDYCKLYFKYSDKSLLKKHRQIYFAYKELLLQYNAIRKPYILFEKSPTLFCYAVKCYYRLCQRSWM